MGEERVCGGVDVTAWRQHVLPVVAVDECGRCSALWEGRKSSHDEIISRGERGSTLSHTHTGERNGHFDWRLYAKGSIGSAAETEPWHRCQFGWIAGKGRWLEEG